MLFNISMQRMQKILELKSMGDWFEVTYYDRINFLKSQQKCLNETVFMFRYQNERAVGREFDEVCS